MRFWFIIGVLFFLTLKESESITQSSCRTESVNWRFCSQKLKTCYPIIDEVDNGDFTVSSEDRLTLGFNLTRKKGINFLPTNVSSVFPDLIAFNAYRCSVTTITRNHFKNLSKLEYLVLVNNKIEHVASDAFVDLVSLKYLYLKNNKIQSLSANTFSSLKNLKQLGLKGNQIQHLDPEIFKSLVKVEAITLGYNLIATLDKKIFESLTNLRQIQLSKNKIKEIPGNLWQNSSKLKYIKLDENEIEFIDANMFDHLLNLSRVNLEGNLCVNKIYGKESFDKMRSDLKQNCKTVQLSAACGAPRHTLVGGESFTRGAFPWRVALMLTKTSPPEFFCAGTLISKTFVVSAAHCILEKCAITQFLPRDVLALFGAHDLDNPYESERITLPPVEIFIHEDWNHLTTNYDADISLLKFENGKITFGNFIQPICLWDSETDPNVTTGVVTGWEKSEDTAKFYEKMPNIITAPTLPHEKCSLNNTDLIAISSERTFCAGLRNGSEVCNGDSGGGLFIVVDGLYFLRGIASFSKTTDQDCDLSRNAVFTNVPKFMDWIQELTKPMSNSFHDHQCGNTKQTTGMIVRGESFERGSFPWLVALKYKENNEWGFFCGGTVISSTFVLTAAHCINGKFTTEIRKPKDIIAIFGAHDLDSTAEIGRYELQPIHITIHEDWDYNSTEYDADLALLRFKRESITFNLFVQPICLWNSENEPIEKLGTVAGWGESEDKTKFHETIPRQISALILNPKRCMAGNPKLATIFSERSLCAGWRNGTGVCRGDSGGALFIKVDGVRYLRGIVSSSSLTDELECDTFENAIYTDVLEFKDWLENEIS